MATVDLPLSGLQGERLKGWMEAVKRFKNAQKEYNESRRALIQAEQSMIRDVPEVPIDCIEE